MMSKTSKRKEKRKLQRPLIVWIIAIFILSVFTLILYNRYRITHLKNEISEINKTKWVAYPYSYHSIPSTSVQNQKINELYRLLAEQNLKSSQAVLSSVRWTYILTGGVASLLIALGTFIGIRYLLPRYVNDQIKEWIGTSSEIKKLETSVKEACRESYLAIGYILIMRALNNWSNSKSTKDKETRKYYLNRAIDRTKRALEFIEKAFECKPSQTKDEELDFGLAKGNLAYYYAAQLINVSEAYSYADEALEIGKKYEKLNIIDDYLFVVKQFSLRDRERYTKAQNIFHDYKDKLKKMDMLKPEELKDYEDFFK